MGFYKPTNITGGAPSCGSSFLVLTSLRFRAVIFSRCARRTAILTSRSRAPATNPTALRPGVDDD